MKMADDTLFQLEKTIAERMLSANAASYVATLNTKGLDKILIKVGEEAVETIIAAKGGERHHIIYETADLLFHLLVMLGHQQIALTDVLSELERREGTSGIDEKNARNRP
ncbi:MAG: phosphoribosyl-ATP diphosphatase [Betaproteobacteria bacterium]|nr:phosphoribosyl-ATP diphosphatase [Betaproteobacteria bacterium]